MADKNFLVIINSLNPDELNTIGEILYEHRDLNITVYLLCCTPYIPSRFFQLSSAEIGAQDNHKQAIKMLSDIGQHFKIKQEHLLHQEGSVFKQAKYLTKQLRIHHVIAGNVIMQEMAKKPGKVCFNKEVRMDSINKMDYYCQSCHKHTSDLGHDVR